MENIFTGVFYTTGLMGEKYLDRWLYKGRGRPKKGDYSTADVLQRELNQEMNNRINRQMLEVFPPYNFQNSKETQ